MTDEELEQQIARAVRAAIAAHPGASAEAIADILAGPQARDPHQGLAGVSEVVISEIGVTDPDDDNAIDEVAQASMRDVGAAEIGAMAWLCIRRVAAALLGTPGRRPPAASG